MVGHWDLQKCRERLNDPTIIDRTITQFIRRCPCCQVINRLKILIRTHLFTCASYNPFESLNIDHIGGQVIPHQDYGCVRCILEVGRVIPHQDARVHDKWTYEQRICFFRFFTYRLDTYRRKAVLFD